MIVYYLGLTILIILMSMFGTIIAFGVPLPFLKHPLFQDNNAQYMIATFSNPAAPFVGEPTPPNDFITNVAGVMYTGAALNVGSAKGGSTGPSVAVASDGPKMATASFDSAAKIPTLNPSETNQRHNNRLAGLGVTGQDFGTNLYNMIDYSKAFVVSRVI